MSAIKSQSVVIFVSLLVAGRYGAKAVAKWKFETWNEPDLKGYNVLNMTLEGLRRNASERCPLLTFSSHHRVRRISERHQRWGKSCREAILTEQHHQAERACRAVQG